MSKFSEKPVGILTASDLKSAKGKTLYWVFFGCIIILCLISIIPTFWVICTSFKDTQEIYTSTSFFPKDMSLTTLRTRITDSLAVLKMKNSFVNTIWYGFGCLFFSLVVDGLAGYGLSKLKPKGHKALFMLIVWSIMLPAQIRTVPNYISYINWPFIAETKFEVNILDTYWPLWLGCAANAYAMVLFKNNFDSIPLSYLEAARIDGAGDLYIFAKIMVPLSMPIIIYVSVGVVNSTWSNFYGPYLLIQDVKKMIVPVKVFLMQGNPTIKKNSYLMGLVISAIPPFIIYFIFQRQIMGGVNIGGVKG